MQHPPKAPELRFVSAGVEEVFGVPRDRALASYDALMGLVFPDDLSALNAVIARQGSVADFIEKFSGSDRAVADFLSEDVLARQTPEIPDFLLRTSILRQFNASLCQALSPRSDSLRILAQLDAANLFITPISSGNSGSVNSARWRN